MSKRYINKYGQLWERISEYYVWNPKCGKGLWNKGNGLTPVK